MKIARILLFIIILIGIGLAIIYRNQFDIKMLQIWIEGDYGVILFMTFYSIATVFFLPGSVFTLAGGALFGPLWGTFYSLTAATIGAILAFLAARYIASDWIADKIGGRLKSVLDGVADEGWRFVAFVRLVPLFPFNLLNYALGLTRIKLLEYSLTTYICMLPGTIAYTYLGYVGRAAMAGESELIQKIMLAIALLATIAFLPRFIVKLRQAKN